MRSLAVVHAEAKQPFKDRSGRAVAKKTQFFMFKRDIDFPFLVSRFPSARVSLMLFLAAVAAISKKEIDRAQGR